MIKYSDVEFANSEKQGSAALTNKKQENFVQIYSYNSKCTVEGRDCINSTKKKILKVNYLNKVKIGVKRFI